MGFFTGLLSVLGANNTLQETVHDSAQSLFKIADDAFYTDQEKAENKAKILPELIDLYKSMASENTGTSLARRWALVVITCNNFILAYLYLTFKVAGREDVCQAIMMIVDLFKLGWAFVAAWGFYFMTHVFDAISSGKDQ